MDNNSELSEEILSNSSYRSEKREESINKHLPGETLTIFKNIVSHDSLDMFLENFNKFSQSFQVRCQTKCISSSCSNSLFNFDYILYSRTLKFCKHSLVLLENRKFFEETFQVVFPRLNRKQIKMLKDSSLFNIEEYLKQIQKDQNGFKGFSRGNKSLIYTYNWEAYFDSFEKRYKIRTPEKESKKRLLKIVKTSRGSQGIQNILEKLINVGPFGTNFNPPEKECIFILKSLKDFSFHVMVDLNANYVIQKVLELEQTHEFFLTHYLKPFVFKLSNNPIGTRIVQKYISCSTDLSYFLSVVIEDLPFFTSNLHAHFILKKLFCRLSSHNWLVEEIVSDNFEYENLLILNFFRQMIDFMVPIASTRYGPQILSKIETTIDFIKNNHALEHIPNFNMTNFQKVLKTFDNEFMTGIMKNLPSVVFDKHGNYLIQELLSDTSLERMKNVIYKFLLRNAYLLATDKFASNVLQLVIKSGNVSFNEKLNLVFMKKFIVENNRRKPFIYHLSKDLYGNYIIQNLYNLSSDKEKANIKRVLKDNYRELEESYYGKFLLFKFGIQKNE